MGEVYLAYDPRLSRDVALKVLSEESASRSNRVQKFRDEARLVASLNHPNIATVHAFESEGGRACLAMEYVPGQSLAERLKEDPLPLGETLAIAEQLADALQAAHAAGLVHRDLKPGNVMLRPDGTVKVLDFGLARDVSHSSSKRVDTSQDSIVGTAGYAAPEQLRRKDIGQQVDLWAYGCILYECLCGRKAFGGKDVRATVLATIQQDPDLSLLPEGTPDALRQLILGCLAKSPHDRIMDFEDVLLRLRRIRNSLSRPLRDRTRWLAPLLSAIAAGVLIAILIWALNGQQPGLGDSDSPPQIATGMGGSGGGSSSGTGPGDRPLTNPEPTPKPADQSASPTENSAAQSAVSMGQSDQQAAESPEDPNRGEFDTDDLKILAEDIKDPPRIVGGGGGSIFVDEGRGQSIVYVIDFSGSMDGTRLNAAKRHLLKDIERLEPQMRFYVIFFDVQVS
jgi:serine/threonine protein kinase